MRRLHVIGMPHTQTTHEYLHCAYTQKTLKFCDMMSEDHEVILYAGEQNEARCAEHVPLVTEDWRRGHFGEWDPNGMFTNIDFSPAMPYWAEWNALAVREIMQRAEPQDALCLVMGGSQAPIAFALPHLTPVEWAVGYEGIVPTFFHVFESYAWMHTVYGMNRWGDGRAFDTVIPNFFDPNDFLVTGRKRSDDYLLFIGRITKRKGPHVAAEIAARVGKKLLVAGPGAHHVEPGLIRADWIDIPGDHVEYIGPVGLEERAQLMTDAAAVIVPTQYVEPFGGVAVEAMMCGTPVVTTDWGAFTETVPWHAGRRFSTLAEGARAVREVEGLDRASIRRYAESRFSLDAVRPQFTAYFERLRTLWGDGYYA